MSRVQSVNKFDDVPDEIRRRMSKVRKKDTKPEILVRSAAHRLGYRFRLHRTDLPGTPDLTFPGLRKAIFVHGCFWHRHDCRLAGKVPTKRQE
jgi:DNA mismatch endonuclease (patch repair protein)